MKENEKKHAITISKFSVGVKVNETEYYDASDMTVYLDLTEEEGKRMATTIKLYASLLEEIKDKTRFKALFGEYNIVDDISVERIEKVGNRWSKQHLDSLI